MQVHAIVDVCIDISYDAVFTAKKVAPMVASRKVRSVKNWFRSSFTNASPAQTANNISKWNQVQEVLKEGVDASAPAAAAPVPVVRACPFTPDLLPETCADRRYMCL